MVAAAHRLDRVVRAIGCRQIGHVHRFQDEQTLRQYESSRRGQRRGRDLRAAIGKFDRCALDHAVVLQVGQFPQAACRLDTLCELARKISVIKSVSTLIRQHAQRARQLRLNYDETGRDRLSVIEKTSGGLAVVLQQRFAHRARRRIARVRRESLVCQTDRWCQRTRQR